jgi:hypothetical protein
MFYQEFLKTLYEDYNHRGSIRDMDIYDLIEAIIRTLDKVDESDVE